MKEYKEINIDIILIEKADIVRTSPGGVDYGKDPDNGGDLGWGV